MVKDFVFEEKYVDIPIGVIGIDQGLIPDFIEDTTNQDNIKNPHTRSCFGRTNSNTLKTYAIKEIHQRKEKCSAIRLHFISPRT